MFPYKTEAGELTSWEGNVKMEQRAIWRCWPWRFQSCSHKPRNARSYKKLEKVRNGLSPRAGVPNLWGLMPDDLRWSWCNTRNTVHNVMCLNHPETIPPSVHGKICLPHNWSLVPKAWGPPAYSFQRACGLSSSIISA